MPTLDPICISYKLNDFAASFGNDPIFNVWCDCSKIFYKHKTKFFKCDLFIFSPVDLSLIIIIRSTLLKPRTSCFSSLQATMTFHSVLC